ncbi:MAG: HAD hydrolase family protein, partial [Lactococcus plantarum]|nr:HAD hydrolase family protein [Lactococcus plantarum]
EMFHMTVPFFGKESGEISVKGNDKSTAIKIVLDKLNLTKTDAISFGDANNDLAMFSACGYNVAMGNGTNELKAVADEITQHVDDDGIAKSLIKHNYFKV